jgi:hypothetical protein
MPHLVCKVRAVPGHAMLLEVGIPSRAVVVRLRLGLRLNLACCGLCCLALLPKETETDGIDTG